MDFDLTEQQRSLQQQAREFRERECPPEFEARLDETGEFPQALHEAMAAAGFFGLPFPSRYGGSDGNILDVVLVAEQLAGSSNTAVNMFLVPVVFGGMLILQCGNDAQREEFLPRLIPGEVMFCFGLTEPEAGSDPRSIKTYAVRDGDDYLISGTKYWTTGASVADFILVVALTNREVDPSQGMSIFMVPRDAEGLEIIPIPKLAGNAYPSCEVRLADVRVPAANIVGGQDCENAGWFQLLSTADLERICVAASALGCAQTVLDTSLAFARERVQFGRPIFKFQAIQHSLADMATRIEAMRWMTYHAAWLKASGRECFKEICMAKLFCSESLSDIVHHGMKILGGRGYSMEFSMQRMLRESYLALYAGGTAEIQRTIISRFL